MPQVDLLQLIFNLMPGFLTAWIFYSFTPHLRPSAFERVVQALIFSTIVQVITWTLGGVLHWLGSSDALGSWTSDARLAASVAVAVILGLFLSVFANHDWLHSALRVVRFTSRTSYPSEWYSAWFQHQRYTMLHLKDGRRIYGWPMEWSDRPDSGHIVLADAEWVTADGQRIPLKGVWSIMVAAQDVAFVEFLKWPEESAA